MSAAETPSSLAFRFEEIEAKLTLAEDLLETLNSTVYRQQRHIERLERELRALREEMEGLLAGAEPRGAQNEVPPHY